MSSSGRVPASVSPGLVLFLLAVSNVSFAQEGSPPGGDVEALRREIAGVRRDYEERLAALEARLDALSAPATPVAPETAAAPVGPPSPPAAPTPVAADVSPNVSAASVLPSSSKVFNPDIAVIGNFLGAAGRNPDPSAPPSLEMHEAEASFQAAVDPYAKADFFLAFSPEGAEIE